MSILQLSELKSVVVSLELIIKELKETIKRLNEENIELKKKKKNGKI